MQIKKILWPTDFSGSAQQASTYVQSLTEKYGAEIHVLYVIEDIAHHKDWYGQFEPDRIEKIFEWERAKAGERLEKICSDHLSGCPLYVRHVAVGDPAQEILRLIEQEGVDLVVMSTSGARGIFRFGSVTEKVVKNASVPVVSIPPSGNPLEFNAA